MRYLKKKKKLKEEEEIVLYFNQNILTVFSQKNKIKTRRQNIQAVIVKEYINN